jgi:hypothetical protein
MALQSPRPENGLSQEFIRGSVANTFLAQVANPAEAFPRLKSWADANGYALDGNESAGRFAGTPSGFAGALIGRITGTYQVAGNLVTIRTDKSLPAGAVANALSQFGMTLVRSS